MAQKIVVSFPGSLPTETVESKKKALANTLGVCCEDIVILLGGLSVSVVDIPDDMIKGREKADKDAEKAAKDAEKEAAVAETEAAKPATKTFFGHGKKTE